MLTFLLVLCVITLHIIGLIDVCVGGYLVLVCCSCGVVCLSCGGSFWCFGARAVWLKAVTVGGLGVYCCIGFLLFAGVMLVVSVWVVLCVYVYDMV